MSSSSVSSQRQVFQPDNVVRLLRRQLVVTIREWHRRAVSRRELALLSLADLKDIGFPAKTEIEKAQPFWRK